MSTRRIVAARYFLPAGNNRIGRAEEGKSGRNAAGRDRFRTRVEYFPAATGMEIKSGLIDEASVCQTFHLESKDKIRLRDRKIFYVHPRPKPEFQWTRFGFFIVTKIRLTFFAFPQPLVQNPFYLCESTFEEVICLRQKWLFDYRS